MDTEDITDTVVDHDENIVELQWTEAFKEDNLEEFTIHGCMVEMVIHCGCESV